MATTTFHFPQNDVENDLVALEVFDPSKHAARFVHLVQAHPEVFTYVSFPVLDSVDDFLTQVYNPIAASPADCLYAIVDKTVAADNDTNLAGVLSLNDTSVTDAATELGVLVFPPFQRTHVASNAIGLALIWLLDPPTNSSLGDGGLGLRRVAWQTNADNAASRRVALRMGFELEGILRWQRAFVPNRPCQQGRGLSTEELAARNSRSSNGSSGDSNGNSGHQNTAAPGRHTAVFSLVWDEWADKRPGVLEQMARRA